MMMSIDILHICRYYAWVSITSRFLDSTGFSNTLNAKRSSVNNLHQHFDSDFAKSQMSV